ncbi:MAG: hypothetical protein ACYCVE_03605 [Gemmatimonadaceae bacterium]
MSFVAVAHVASTTPSVSRHRQSHAASMCELPTMSIVSRRTWAMAGARVVIHCWTMAWYRTLSGCSRAAAICLATASPGTAMVLSRVKKRAHCAPSWISCQPRSATRSTGGSHQVPPLGRTTTSSVAPAVHGAQSVTRPSESAETAAPSTAYVPLGMNSPACSCSVSPPSSTGTRAEKPIAAMDRRTVESARIVSSGAQSADGRIASAALGACFQMVMPIGRDSMSRSAVTLTGTAAEPRRSAGMESSALSAPAGNSPARSRAPPASAPRASSPQGAPSVAAGCEPPAAMVAVVCVDPNSNRAADSVDPPRSAQTSSGTVSTPSASRAVLGAATGPTRNRDAAAAVGTVTSGESEAMMSPTGSGLSARKRAPIPMPPPRFTTLYTRRFTPRCSRSVSVSVPVPTPRAMSRRSSSAPFSHTITSSSLSTPSVTVRSSGLARYVSAYAATLSSVVAAKALKKSNCPNSSMATGCHTWPPALWPARAMSVAGLPMSCLSRRKAPVSTGKGPMSSQGTTGRSQMRDAALAVWARADDAAAPRAKRASHAAARRSVRTDMSGDLGKLSGRTRAHDGNIAPPGKMTPRAASYQRALYLAEARSRRLRRCRCSQVWPMTSPSLAPTTPPASAPTSTESSTGNGRCGMCVATCAASPCAATRRP